MTYIAINVVMYATIAFWFTYSMITKGEVVRMSIAFIYCFQIAIFGFSLISVKRLVDTMINRERFKVNEWTLYSLLISSGSTFVLSLIIFILSYVAPKEGETFTER